MTMDLTRRRLMEGAAALTLAACSRPDTKAAPAPAGDVLGDLDALGVAEKIRERQFTAVEAIDAAIGRAQKVQPQINFLVTDMFQRARDEATKAPPGTFGGVPTL